MSLGPDDPAGERAEIRATPALRRALVGVRNEAEARDLLFLEAWERNPLAGAAAARRVAQIRRANPDLAAAIRREVANPE